MTDDGCCTPLDGAVTSTPKVRRVRRAAFDVLRTGASPRLSDLARHTGLALEHVREVLRELVAGGIATVDGDLAGDPVVVGAEGLTVRATAHQLILGNQVLYTWCAFDTIGIPAALAVDAVARTACPTCGAAIELTLPNGQPPPNPVVGWWPLVASGLVNESFCPTASLFCNSDHLDTWRVATATAPGEALPLTALAERGRQTWSLFVDLGDRP